MIRFGGDCPGPGAVAQSCYMDWPPGADPAFAPQRSMALQGRDWGRNWGRNWGHDWAHDWGPVSFGLGQVVAPPRPPVAKRRIACHKFAVMFCAYTDL